MKNRLKALILTAAFAAVSLTGCRGADGAENRDPAELSPDLLYTGSMETVYAKEFSVDRYEGGYALLTVAGDSRYLVVPEDQPVPALKDEEVTVLKQPLTNLYLAASGSMDFFRSLGAMDRITFSGTQKQDWCMEEPKEAMEDGTLLYAGKYNAPDYELLLENGCSLAIENTMIYHAPEAAEKLKKLGIPVFTDHASREKHPLGRVEWIRLYGVLMGEEEKAEEAFRLQQGYLEKLPEPQSGEADRPTAAFFYITSSGAVNVRRSSDYIPKMIELAGGSYLPKTEDKEESRRSSVNIQMEEFYAAAREADYLIYNSTVDGEPETLADLLGKSSLLQDFKAVREGNVWCTSRSLYQETMAIGRMTEDFRLLFSGSGDGEEMEYLYRLRGEEGEADE